MAPQYCLVCGLRGRFRCSGCRVAYYCSKNHQKIDRMVHDSNCHPYQLVWDDSTGHHLVASRDLEAGSFILYEDPLVIGIPFTEDYFTFCLGCSEEGVSPVSCPQCAWPSMCGKEECWAEGSPHAMGECAWFKSIGLKMSTEVFKELRSQDAKDIQLLILLLRCILLKDREPRKWKKMMEMELKYGDLISRCQHDLPYKYKEAVADLVFNWTRETNSNISRDSIGKICDMFHLLNSFRINSNMFGHTSSGPIGLFSMASRISHSCVSNASAVFRADGKITVRAAVPIPKGSKILYTYECNPLNGTFERNYVLVLMLGTTRFVGCYCDRCKDPSELGSFIGGIYCPVCSDQQGILLPLIPRKEDSEMMCNKCRTRCTYEFVENSILRPFEVDYGKLLENEEMDEDYLNRYEAFICKYEKMIHRHSPIVIRCKGSLLLKYFFKYDLNPELQSDEILRRRYDLALELLKLIDIVSPGMNRWRGTILFHLVIVMELRMRKRNEILDQVINGMLMEAYTILSLEPRGSTEACYASKLGQILIKRWKRDASIAVTDC